MTICYLGLGSNLKYPERFLRLAIQSLRKTRKIQILRVADFILTEPWGIKAQPRFCNTVIAIKTQYSPLDLLQYCQKLEKKFGRVRKKHWGPRTLDIDILLYGDKIVKTSALTVPHPYMMEREFVLKPLRTLISI